MRKRPCGTSSSHIDEKTPYHLCCAIAKSNRKKRPIIGNQRPTADLTGFDLFLVINWATPKPLRSVTNTLTPQISAWGKIRSLVSVGWSVVKVPVLLPLSHELVNLKFMLIHQQQLACVDGFDSLPAPHCWCSQHQRTEQWLCLRSRTSPRVLLVSTSLFVCTAPAISTGCCCTCPQHHRQPLCSAQPHKKCSHPLYLSLTWYEPWTLEVDLTQWHIFVSRTFAVARCFILCLSKVKSLFTFSITICGVFESAVVPIADGCHPRLGSQLFRAELREVLLKM
jgi:hypothetical protein